MPSSPQAQVPWASAFGASSCQGPGWVVLALNHFGNQLLAASGCWEVFVLSPKAGDPGLWPWRSASLAEWGQSPAWGSQVAGDQMELTSVSPQSLWVGTGVHEGPLASRSLCHPQEEPSASWAPQWFASALSRGGDGWGSGSVGTAQLAWGVWQSWTDWYFF